MGKFTLHSSVPGTIGKNTDTDTTIDLTDMELADVCVDLEVMLIHFAHNIDKGGELGKGNKKLATVAMNALRYCRDLASLLEVCKECALDDVCFPMPPDARIH